MALVSIVIPVYNAERFIGRCFDSIMSQTYCKWEVVAVDDGSKDDSLKIMNRYASDRRFKLISIPNGGVVNARKTGLNHAVGDLLMFVDADDYLPDDAISVLVEGMSDSKVDIALGGYTLHWEYDGHKKDVLNAKKFDTAEACVDYCVKHGETFLPVKMYRTDLFKKAVNIPADIVFMEDTVGVLQYLAVCRMVATIDKSIYVYYKNEGSASMRLKPQSYYSMIKVADFLIEYGIRHNRDCGKILKSKASELLLTVMCHQEIDAGLENKLTESVRNYLGVNKSQHNFNDIMLSLYLNHPDFSVALYSAVNKFSESILTIKSFMGRIIHRILR